MSFTAEQIIGLYKGTADEPSDDVKSLIEEALRRCEDCRTWECPDLLDEEGLCELCR